MGVIICAACGCWTLRQFGPPITTQLCDSLSCPNKTRRLHGPQDIAVTQSGEHLCTHRKTLSFVVQCEAYRRYDSPSKSPQSRHNLNMKVWKKITQYIIHMCSILECNQNEKILINMNHPSTIHNSIFKVQKWYFRFNFFYILFIIFML